jgi:hypothetical protein
MNMDKENLKAAKNAKDAKRVKTNNVNGFFASFAD